MERVRPRRPSKERVPKEIDQAATPMERYVALEISRSGESLEEIKLAGHFSYDVADGLQFEIDVYEVKLKSGVRVFAAEGGYGQKVSNIFSAEIPDAETAAKLHVYILIKQLVKGLRDAESRAYPNKVADSLELDKKYRN